MRFGRQPNVPQMLHHNDMTAATVRARQADAYTDLESMVQIAQSTLQQFAQQWAIGVCPADRQVCLPLLIALKDCAHRMSPRK